MRIAKRSLSVPITAVVLAFGLASTARAARLQEVHRDIVTQPEPVQPPGSATPAIEPFVTEASVSDTFLGVTISFRDSVDCPDAGCSGSFNDNALIAFGAQILPSNGEKIGDPVVLCLRDSYDIDASATGNYTAQSTAGGDPITDPTSVVRTPGNVVVFSDGPHTVTSNGSAVNQFTFPFEALIGDTLNVSTGVKLVGSGTGVGGMEARADTNLVISIGPCTRPAPAASGTGLAVLALSLASIGAFVLRRRLR